MGGIDSVVKFAKDTVEVIFINFLKIFLNIKPNQKSLYLYTRKGHTKDVND